MLGGARSRTYNRFASLRIQMFLNSLVPLSVRRSISTGTFRSAPGAGELRNFQRHKNICKPNDSKSCCLRSLLTLVRDFVGSRFGLCSLRFVRVSAGRSSDQVLGFVCCYFLKSCTEFLAGNLEVFNIYCGSGRKLNEMNSRGGRKFSGFSFGQRPRTNASTSCSLNAVPPPPSVLGNANVRHTSPRFSVVTGAASERQNPNRDGLSSQYPMPQTTNKQGYSTMNAISSSAMTSGYGISSSRPKSEEEYVLTNN